MMRVLRKIDLLQAYYGSRDERKREPSKRIGTTALVQSTASVSSVMYRRVV